MGWGRLLVTLTVLYALNAYERLAAGCAAVKADVISRCERCGRSEAIPHSQRARECAVVVVAFVPVVVDRFEHFVFLLLHIHITIATELSRIS